MNNKIVYIKSKDNNFKSMLVDKDCFLVELDGNFIFSLVNYISVIQYKLKFPSDCFDSVDRYLDWIRDLDWIEEKSIVIVIYNYKNFMSDDREYKERILKYFKEDVLYFWEEEVKRIVVGGKPRSFNVYLVD